MILSTIPGYPFKQNRITVTTKYVICRIEKTKASYLIILDKLEEGNKYKKEMAQTIGI